MKETVPSMKMLLETTSLVCKITKEVNSTYFKIGRFPFYERQMMHKLNLQYHPRSPNNADVLRDYQEKIFLHREPMFVIWYLLKFANHCDSLQILLPS